MKTCALLMKSADSWGGQVARCLIREFFPRFFYLSTYIF